MGKVRFNISMSIDGYVAGPDQTLEHPLGKGGESLHEWVIRTRTFRAMAGTGGGGETGLDDDRAAYWRRNIGATIMGRNMFGPIRGDWGDEQWRGWWGDNPPFHGPVFVLTHHARDPIEMDGGTTFYFVTDGPEAALERARAAAGDADVNIGGGAATARQYLRAGQIDEMELHVVPAILGGGERLFDELDRPPAGLEFVEVLSSRVVAHFRYARPEPGAQQRDARGRDRRIRAPSNPGSATTQATPAARFDPVRVAMTAQVERGVAPGLVFLVAQGSEVHAEAVGMKAFAGRDPMRRDTIFRITSMTKPVAAAAAMILVEEGKLSLDEPVDRLLPELADRRVLKRIDGPLDDTVPAKRPITVRDLLTMRLGFGLLFEPAYPIVRAADEQGVNIVPPDPSVTFSPDTWIQRFATLPLMHQPGERWLYGTGSNVLGVLIGRAAGQPFDAFLRDRIFAPLGMNDTGFIVPADKLHRLATSYQTDPKTGAQTVYDGDVDSRWAQPPAFPSGANGLVSTADDYLAFARMLLGKGAAGAARILSPASVAQMTANQLTPEQRATAGPILDAGRGWGFGMSVVVEPKPGLPTPGSYGWYGGFGTVWENDPNVDLAAIALTQSVDFLFAGGPGDFWAAVYRAIAA